MPKKILLFCDPGIDDSLAIMYTLMDPRLELVGVVTSYGNVTKETATANAAYLLSLGGKPNIPIIPGAAQPVQQEEVTYYPEIHGEEGIGPIRPPSDLKYRLYPFDMIRKLIEFYRDELIIVDTGRSTTLATAFILYKEQMEMVGGFYLMGGAFFAPGNVTPLAEANFHGDPTSSNYILKFAHNLTITPLNVTNAAYLTPDVIDALSASTTNPYASMIKPIFNYYYQAYKEKVPGLVGAPIHDLVTLMVVVNDNIVEYIYYDAKVIEDIEAKGMSYIDLRPGAKDGKTRIAIKLNHEVFISEFKKVMLGNKKG